MISQNIRRRFLSSQELGELTLSTYSTNVGPHGSYTTVIAYWNGERIYNTDEGLSATYGGCVTNVERNTSYSYYIYVYYGTNTDIENGKTGLVTFRYKGKSCTFTLNQTADYVSGQYYAFPTIPTVSNVRVEKTSGTCSYSYGKESTGVTGWTGNGYFGSTNPDHSATFGYYYKLTLGKFISGTITFNNPHLIIGYASGNTIDSGIIADSKSFSIPDLAEAFASNSDRYDVLISNMALLKYNSNGIWYVHSWPEFGIWYQSSYSSFPYDNDVRIPLEFYNDGDRRTVTNSSESNFGKIGFSVPVGIPPSSLTESIVDFGLRLSVSGTITYADGSHTSTTNQPADYTNSWSISYV